jgi:uncharacterized membrane protein
MKPTDLLSCSQESATTAKAMYPVSPWYGILSLQVNMATIYRQQLQMYQTSSQRQPPQGAVLQFDGWVGD